MAAGVVWALNVLQPAFASPMVSHVAIAVEDLAAAVEQYQHLLGVPAAALSQACRRAKVALTRVGEVVAGSGIVVLSPGGERFPLPRGFDHFPSDRAG